MRIKEASVLVSSCVPITVLEGAVASHTEIEQIQKDTKGWRSLAAGILSQIGPGDLRDQDIDFLEQIQVRPGLDILSDPQAKYLLDLHDNIAFVSSHKGKSISWMIRFCQENLATLPEGENEEVDRTWIKDLARQNPHSLRRHEARRLHTLTLSCLGD